MAPQLSEDEIDDLIYLSRTGENDELVQELTALAEREKVTVAEILVAAKDQGNKSTTLHMAAGNGHLETVRKLTGYFEERPKGEKQAFLDDVNEHGNTGLHWAALGGHLDMVKLLMANGALPALANERNYVPLDLAYFNHHTDVANYFLSQTKGMEDKNQEEGLKDAVASVDIKDDDTKAEDGDAAKSS
ncbi:uncharacterized protein GMORB2_2745 [Geosmithia morbida]|uniref:Uncharacterized protein n=1 Tax=Geosmithia morbida TaxID=1094350 RepID=A0A9P4YPH8_9HYPO|nr:uncharacterized protein GMORB2_2745 [Geosmithia morbida]KAF4120741.1 uncharacterized protein GMORB2_2745 [Geosmithia morbida]